MSDVKLFRVGSAKASELMPRGVQVERTLQTLFETNLEALLGVRFLASEYSTGAVHGGRIDTLGIDEDGSPVIVEYKRSINENVINQGLFYLDWLMDHRKEFQWLVMECFGQDAAAGVEWAAPRLICIAGDFTRYDGHAVKQINRSIELLRYRHFADDLLMIELVHVPRTSARVAAAITLIPDPGHARVEVASDLDAIDPYRSQRIDYRLANASPNVRAVWDTTVAFLSALGDDVQTKELKYYLAFKRIKNFACLEVYPSAKTVVAYLKLDPGSVLLEPGFTRDVSKIGHFGTGNLEVVLRCGDDAAKAMPLLQRAYDQN